MHFYWRTGIGMNIWGRFWRRLSNFSSDHSGKTIGNTGIPACDLSIIFISRREFWNENWNRPDFVRAFYWSPLLFKIPLFFPVTLDRGTGSDNILCHLCAFARVNLLQQKHLSLCAESAFCPEAVKIYAWWYRVCVVIPSVPMYPLQPLILCRSAHQRPDRLA